MRKIGLKSSNPQESGDKSGQKKDRKEWLKNNQRPIIAMSMIILVAFFLRIFFAYGESAGSDFALSGGTTASEHLHTITEIVTAGSLFGVDGSLFYPFGSTNMNPPLMDLVLAAFAMIGKACGMSAVSASQAVLAWSAVIFGTLSCVAMYYLGKELLNSKTAGYLSALFLAFCPVVISQTVFSNGTEIAFIAFMFIILSYFMVKGVKLLNNDTSIDGKVGEAYKANKAAMKYALISGVLLAIIAYSWNGFRSVVVVMIAAMAVFALLDRFRGKDIRPTMLFFAIPILIGVLAAAPYYILMGLWDAVFSGVLIASLMAVAVCMIFAFTQKKPWTLTLPVIVIALVVVFVLLYFFSPSYFSAIVAGNSYYVGTFASLMSSSSVSLSTLAVDFGFLTMWFGLVAVAYMLYKSPKNLGSIPYVFTIVWMIACMYFAIKSSAYATVFAPAFAIGFAAVIVWLFKKVDFKAYFASFKGADIKSVWKRLFKPIPFVSVLVVLLLICAPNAMYAIDGSTSTNNESKYNDQMDDLFQKDMLGSVGYYIKTDGDWKVNPVFSSYNGVDKDGALVTWIDYAYDAATFGNFDVIVDSSGNGSSAMANILLSNGSDGSSTAAMLIYLMQYYGLEKSKAVLYEKGMSESIFNDIKNAFENPSQYKESMLNDTTKYGVLSTGISDENVTYIYVKTLLTDNYSGYEISEMYEAMSTACGKDISYFMVTGNMFPMYYGYSSVFATMSYLNGYSLADSYGTVSQFLKIDTVTQYYGLYGYTDAMYNTLLWRTYIGMSPTEAGFTGTYAALQYISALSLSDGTYKATPGYGLSNYEVDYDHWYVMYNPDDKATVSSSGWVKMLYNDAVSKQDVDGGLINYLSGLPVMMKYVNNNEKTVVTGNVTDSDGNIMEGVRVAVFDGEGVQRATTFTGVDGSYSVLANIGDTIVYSAGSTSLTGGSTIKSVIFDGTNTVINVAVPKTTLSGTLTTADSTLGELNITLKGTALGETYHVTTVAKAFSLTLVPDTYTITVTSQDGKITYATTSYLTAVGSNVGLEITLDSATITVTLKNDVGVLLPEVSVTLTNVDSGAVFTGTTDSDGKAAISVTPGTYRYGIGTTGYTTSAASIDVDADDKETATVTAVSSTTVDVKGLPKGQMASIYGGSYQNSVSTGAGDISVKLPTGTAGGAKYAIYAVDGMVSGTSKVYWSVMSSETTSLTVKSYVGYLVSGTLKNSSGTAVTGTIVFADSADSSKMACVTADSDGKYQILLPAGTYTIYANNGSSNVYIGSYEVKADSVDAESNAITLDITMEAARKITVNTYWYSSTYKMQYMPLTVNGTITKDGTSFTYELSFLSNSSGTATIYIPLNTGCTIKSSIANGYYYYADGEEKLTEKTETISEGTSSETKRFTATATPITVTNGSDIYKIKVGTVEIEPGKTGEVSVTSTSVSVSVDETLDSGAYYYYSGTTSVTPGATPTITVDAVGYDVLKITGLNDTDNVSITAVDDGEQKSKTSTGTEREYYLEDGKSFLVKVTDADGKKVMYKYVDASKTMGAIAVSFTDSVEVSGYVGMSASGTLTIYEGSEDADDKKILDVSISSTGKYSVTLPYSENGYTFSAMVTATVSDLEYTYTGKVIVDASQVSKTEAKEINIAVVGGDKGTEPEDDTDTAAAAADEDTGVKSTALTITKMSGVNTPKATIEFKLVVDADDNTYILSGGSSWSTVRFYSDEAMTMEITSVTGSSTIYGRGTIASATVAAGSSNLSVVLKTLGGEEAATATFEKTDAKWEKTTATSGTTKVNYGTDEVNDAEYKYAVTIVNDDNYTKTFTLALDKEQYDALIAAGWYVTFMDGNKIADWSADGLTVTVDGYSSLTVYVKVTTKDSTVRTIPTLVQTTITTTETAGLSTDEEAGITVNGSTATIKSNPDESKVSVGGLNASGRGVLNDKGDVPVYAWILFGLMVVMLVFAVWLGMRRGVFARKK